MSKQQTCEQRIDENMQHTEQHIRALLTVAFNEQNDLDDEDADDVELLRYINNNDIVDTDLFEYPLGVDIRKSYRIHLSTGGPASFIEVITDIYDEIIDVYYHYQDWFDGAKRKVNETSPIYRYVMGMLEDHKEIYYNK